MADPDATRACPMNRLRIWLRELLIASDQVAHVFFGGPKYLICGGPCPSADETISSKVGRQALRGKRWARACEIPINLLFLPLEGEWHHCRRCIEHDELSEELRNELERMGRPGGGQA